jgi:hypothetical protein
VVIDLLCCHCFLLSLCVSRNFETLNEFVPGEHVSRPHDSSVWYLPFVPLMSGRWISCYSFLKISPWSTSDRPKTLSTDDQGSYNEDIEAANNLMLSIALTSQLFPKSINISFKDENRSYCAYFVVC